ncbi:UDP-glucoronosyl and UDP-glucosyl transferase domain-containing protein [Apiospora phragmitis]|uniref:UDP-glucoronosyl and UDP-glucosyl transferase domain-containing protein n=1 Tax=Apiospora phragmitis TaxID=2905665 RepID=A0ABR1VE89_9PEZI
MSAQPDAPSAGDKPKWKFLLHTFYATGHVLPMQAVAQALVQRGHEVVWLASPDQKARVEASGAQFVATDEVVKVDTMLKTTEPTTLEGCVEALFGGRLAAQVADLRRILASYAPDCLLNDALPQGAAALYDLGEVPFFATLGVVPLYLPDAGEHAPTSALGTLLSQHRWTLPVINPQREALGLKPLSESDVVQYSAQLHIQASCPSLEYHQAMPQTHYVGPLVSQQTKSPDLPVWWDDVLAAASSGRHIIGITQGTFAMDPTSLLIPAIEALQDDPSLLLVVPSPHEENIRARLGTTLSLKESQESESNVRVAPWVPYDQLLPLCSALVTNGGYGSVTQALAAGVPLVCAGTSEDKKDTAARVRHVGAGVDLGTERPGVESMRAAVKAVLKDPTYRENAGRMRDELRAQVGAGKACRVLEDDIARSRGERGC